MPDKESEPKVIVDPEEAAEAGYFGSVPDPTPNDAYSVAGVTSSDEAAKADRTAMTGQGNVAPDPTAQAPAKSSTPTKKSGS